MEAAILAGLCVTFYSPSFHSSPLPSSSNCSRALYPSPWKQFFIVPTYWKTPPGGKTFIFKTVEKKSKVAFMTTMDRELFPVKMPYNRFGNEIVPLRGAPHRGPGCYENEDKTSFSYQIEHKINSSKGYTLGARTGPRLQKEAVPMLTRNESLMDFVIKPVEREHTFYRFQTPSPTAYQTQCTEAKEFDKSKKPFYIGSERFPVYKRDVAEVLPGPGAYEHQIKKNRKVQWHQSFGGEPIMMPQAQVRSTIDKNTEKLYSTKEEKKYHRKLAYLKMYYD